MSFDYELPGHWYWSTLNDVKAEGRSVVSGPFGSNIGKRFFVESGVPVIRGNNLSLGMSRFKDDGFVYLTEDKAEEFKNCEAHPGDLLFTAAGTIGQVGIIPPKGRYLKYIISNKQLRARLNSQVIDPLFAYYWFASPDMVTAIQSRNTGSTIPLINLSVIKSLRMPVPPLGEQQQIVAHLSLIDDRIALLRETNATLEAIAQALFKSWFVDFDPVHAKQQGIAPEGMDDATAALFPDSFDESELGLVPRGWKVGKLQDLLVLQRGFDLPSSDRIPGNFPIIAASGPAGTHKTAMAKAPGVVTGRSGVLGRVFLELEDYWPLNTTLWVKEFRAASACYAYELLSLLDFASFNAGSAVPTLNRNHAHSLPYLIPSRACIDAYESVSMKLHARARENRQQAQTLATLRDTLLPRLISGKLRLPEAEAMLEEA